MAGWHFFKVNLRKVAFIDAWRESAFTAGNAMEALWHLIPQWCLRDPARPD
jgi:hypothetical protein